MNVISSPPLHCVVGLDSSPLAELALLEASQVAARAPAAAIHVVTVIDLHRRPPSGTVETARMRELLTSALRKSASGTDLQVFYHLLHGDPAGEILSLAEDVEADLIIVGTHGRRGVKRLLMGSVAEKIVREAACPVLVMRPRRYDPHPELVPEPPCPDCVAVRATSRGATWWCDSHDKPWVPPHRYTYRDGALHQFHADGLGPARPGYRGPHH